MLSPYRAQISFPRGKGPSKSQPHPDVPFLPLVQHVVADPGRLAGTQDSIGTECSLLLLSRNRALCSAIYIFERAGWNYPDSPDRSRPVPTKQQKTNMGKSRGTRWEEPESAHRVLRLGRCRRVHQFGWGRVPRRCEERNVTARYSNTLLVIRWPSPRQSPVVQDHPRTPLALRESWRATR